tara:strand:+ start:21468 stop:21587 length:120 start_codon:yes stop_codon:yes gene_type:complete
MNQIEKEKLTPEEEEEFLWCDYYLTLATIWAEEEAGMAE